MKLKILKAFSGDCIIISFFKNIEKNYNILIDGGITKTYYTSLKEELLRIKDKGEVIDLLIVTHIDNDHIEGIIKFFEDDEFDYDFIKQIIFNCVNELGDEIKITEKSQYCSYRKGNTLKKELCRRRLLPTSMVLAKEKIALGEMKITFLSPIKEDLDKLISVWNKKNIGLEYCQGKKSDYAKTIEELQKNDDKIVDTSITNKSSIAFIAEFNSKKVMMLGDSHPDTIVQSLNELGYSGSNRMKIDYMKLSHHGSKKNLTYKLLNLIQCSNYIISTNGKHMHPNKETLARIIKEEENVKFYYNYGVYKDIFTNEEILRYKIKNSLIDEIIINEE
ncbi:ComEC/Rec2 family competence protein [Clostridium perfringens]|nr:hypothetical protein [Clostridium perfringens]MDU3844137.1 hypothetical protein [Clostridium perfringens]